MTLSDLLGGVQKVAETGASVYTTVQGTKLKETGAPTVSAANPTATGPAPALPWYKAKWVIPAAVVAGLLVVVAVIRRGRR
jgi:hypothetical protein